MFGVFLGRWVHWDPPLATATVSWIDLRTAPASWTLATGTKLPIVGAHPLLATIQSFLSAALDHDAAPHVWRCFLSPCTRDTLFISASEAVAARAWDRGGAFPCEPELGALLSAARDHGALRLTTLEGLRAAAPSLAAPAPSLWPPQLGAAWFDEDALLWRPAPARPRVRHDDACLVGARAGASMQEVLDSGVFREALATVPELPLAVCTVARRDASLVSALSVPTILVLDPDAPYQDTRVLTPRALMSMTVFRLAPRDYAAWAAANPPLAADPVRARTLLVRATQNPSIAVPPHQLVWRAVVHTDDIAPLAAAQRRVVVDLSGTTFTARRVLPWVAPECFIDDSRAWIVPFPHAVTLQIQMVSPNGWERRPRAPREAHMAAFGLARTAAGEWTAPAFWHAVLKRRLDFSLHKGHIDDCLDGFARDQARALCSDAPPQCSVCCDAPCGVLLDACGHSFCIGCTTRMLELRSHGEAARCPVCRAPFAVDTRTWIRTQGRPDPKPVLSRQTAIERLTRRNPSTLVVFADAETAAAGRPWVTNADAVVHVLGEPLPARAFDKLVLTWAWMSVGATGCAAPLTAVHRVIQACAAPNSTVVVVCDTPEEDATDVLNWTRELATAYPRMGVTSKYARDEDVELS